MIPTAAVPRPLRAGAAVVGVGFAGILALAGCSATGAASSADTVDAGTNGTGTGADTQASDTDSRTTSRYADGTYTAEGSYATPESVEQISVTVTLRNDVVTDVEVSGNPTKRESQEYQDKFIGGIADVVVGQDIDAISVSRVAGSSLTSGGFTQAIEQIISEAAG